MAQDNSHNKFEQLNEIDGVCGYTETTGGIFVVSTNLVSREVTSLLESKGYKFVNATLRKRYDHPDFTVKEKCMVLLFKK